MKRDLNEGACLPASLDKSVRSFNSTKIKTSVFCQLERTRLVGLQIGTNVFLSV